MKAAPVLTVLAMALLLPLPLHAQYLTPPTRLGSLVPIKVQSLAPGIEADPGYSLSYRADEDEAFAWKPGGIGAVIGNN